MKNDQTINEQAANEQAANEQAANVQRTPELTKAAAILRARLPKLSEAKLNFEKRTGNFFIASIEKDENGEERVRRLVIEDTKCPPECADEMKVKRAAAVIVNYDAACAKADARVEEAAAILEEYKSQRAALDEERVKAVEIVTAFDLPDAAKRETLKAKVESQADEIARLRAMLAEMGIKA